MSKIVFHGKKRHILRSYLSLSAISLKTLARHSLSRKLDPTWSAMTEIGILFWRHQFKTALNMPDIVEGRAYFDSLQTFTDEIFATQSPIARPTDPPGRWIIPDQLTGKAVLLYLHGGGYTFNAAISDRYGDMLAALTGCKVFALDYPLTPEHQHPAQVDCALAAYRWMLGQTDPARLILIGDSAGGHLALMTLLGARDAGLPQPALAIGLCPWTDIGQRGASMDENNRYDLVQGWMALRFGTYLAGDFTPEYRAGLSPISYDFSGLAPIYLQGGGREVLIDMIQGFARLQTANGAQVRLDIWPHMIHNFQAYGNSLPDSAEALSRLNAAITAGLKGALVAPGPRTQI